MIHIPRFWELPAPVAFLGAIEEQLESGLAIVARDPGMPAGLFDAIERHLRRSRRHWTVERIEPGSGVAPAKALAEPFGAQGSLDALFSTSLHDHAAFVDLGGLPSMGHADWRVFIDRFAARLGTVPEGLVLLVAGLSEHHTKGLGALSWQGRLRRLDATIWADLHAVPDRSEPLMELATALAVELCQWRFDMAEALVRAAPDDLFDPLGWLSRRPERPIPEARSFERAAVRCPLQLFREGNLVALEQRVWRAQLTALFPWLEECRLKLVERHRNVLKLDEHQQALGARDVEDIELGALFRQLSVRLDRRESDRLQALSRIRNRLAHRRAAEPADLRAALRQDRS